MAFLVVGCAGKSTYILPDYLGEKFPAIRSQVESCIIPARPVTYEFSETHELIAMIDGDTILLSEGLFLGDEKILKFSLAHEIGHQRLGHLRSRQTVKHITTGALLVLNAIVPGAGALGLAAHPLTQAHYSKPQEMEADLEAYRACLCMGMTKDEIIGAIRNVLQNSQGGGLFDQHPSGGDRIANIQAH
jgi:Zn-dependent protease with chaperone function